MNEEDILTRSEWVDAWENSEYVSLRRHDDALRERLAITNEALKQSTEHLKRCNERLKEYTRHLKGELPGWAQRVLGWFERESDE